MPWPSPTTRRARPSALLAASIGELRDVGVAAGGGPDAVDAPGGDGQFPVALGGDLHRVAGG